MARFDFDQRTRTPSEIHNTTIGEFHLDEVPTLIVDRGDLATRAFVASGLDQFGVSVDGQTFTWQLDDNGDLEVVEGDTGSGSLVSLSTEWFSDLVNDVRSAVALMISEEFEMPRGNIVQVINWEPVLRALVDGRPANEPGLITFKDRQGAQLDLNRKFVVDDDPADIANFLAETGFLHFKAVFSEIEMARLSELMDEWRARMTPGDRRAWYAKRGDEEICVRVTGLTGNDLDFPYEERLNPIAAVTGKGHQFVGSDLLVKPVGIEEGISDLPWHKDCALGLHSYSCASLTFGVSVTGSDETNGQLGVVAGSHRVNIPLFDVSDELDLPQLFLSTDVGDVTVHLSCAMHCATPPEHTERRVTYTSFKMPGSIDELADKIRQVRDQAGRETYAPT